MDTFEIYAALAVLSLGCGVIGVLIGILIRREIEKKTGM